MNQAKGNDVHKQIRDLTVRPRTGPRLWQCWALAAAVVAAGCADSNVDRPNVDGSELSDATVSAETAGEAGGPLSDDPKAYEVSQASGYVRALVDSAGSGIEHAYDKVPGAGPMIEAVQLIVAGYLVDIVPGVVWADKHVRRRLTPAEVEEMLQSIAERERRARDEHRLSPDLQASYDSYRETILKNALPEPEDIVHTAYRILVTEVLSGDFKAGDILDVQVPLSIFTTLEEQRAALKGTPRAVVGGDWSTHVWSNYELQDANRAPLDEAVFYPWIEMFWLDESLWDPTDAQPDPDGDALIERSVGRAEALYLRGLHDLHPAWGDLETLDDLADAIRAAAAPHDPTTEPPTTTTTEAPTTCTAGCDEEGGG